MAFTINPLYFRYILEHDRVTSYSLLIGSLGEDFKHTQV
jgi:hypothetical protein